VVNARIQTMNPEQPVAEAMWVRDGRVAWVGERDDVPAAAEHEQLVDGGGRALLPGFIEPHMHLAPLAMLHSFENVGPFRFPLIDQALAHLETVAGETPAGEWIVARQFDPSLQDGPDTLTRELLDDVSDVHPVFVYNASLHLAYCNSRALEIAGVDANTPDPPNAEIGRDGDGLPNGVLKAGPAMALVARHNPYVTGLQRQPFLHTDDCGIAYIDPDELNAAVEKRLQEGWAVSIHANGDAAIDRVLDAYERAARLGLDPGARRCRIEHCSILHDDHIRRIAALGLSPSFLIGHVYYWGRAFVDDIFGLEKASKLDRTASCEAAGIRWTLHSDDPVTEMNLLRCIGNAVTRSMWRSDELLSPEECIPVATALRAMTIDAAWQCHSDHEVGSLEVGKFADFVILEDDPRSVGPEQVSGIRVDDTWVNGKQVFARNIGR
jgi:predicted amidohydrolase YtcJ